MDHCVSILHSAPVYCRPVRNYWSSSHAVAVGPISVSCVQNACANYHADRMTARHAATPHIYSSCIKHRPQWGPDEWTRSAGQCTRRLDRSINHYSMIYDTQRTSGMAAIIAGINLFAHSATRGYRRLPTLFRHLTPYKKNKKKKIPQTARSVAL